LGSPGYFRDTKADEAIGLLKNVLEKSSNTNDADNVIIFLLFSFSFFHLLPFPSLLPLLSLLFLFPNLTISTLIYGIRTKRVEPPEKFDKIGSIQMARRSPEQ